MRFAACRAAIIDASELIPHAEVVIDQDQLRAAFLALDAEVPDPYELGGVTFHGPEGHQEWVAFIVSNDDERALGCEGWGAMPIDALNNLRQHMRKEHPEEFNAIRPPPH